MTTMISFLIHNMSQIDEYLEQFCKMLEDGGIGEDDVYRSRLISCELLSNVFLHGGESAHFEALSERGFVEIKVTGGNPTAIKRIALPDAYSESGRGLYIVKNLCGGKIEINGGEIKVTIET